MLAIYGYILLLIPSCKYKNEGLMDLNAVKYGIGECELPKTTVCWHELVSGWDNFLYKDPGSCSFVNDDDYTAIRKK